MQFLGFWSLTLPWCVMGNNKLPCAENGEQDSWRFRLRHKGVSEYLCFGKMDYFQSLENETFWFVTLKVGVLLYFRQGHSESKSRTYRILKNTGSQTRIDKACSLEVRQNQRTQRNLIWTLGEENMWWHVVENSGMWWRIDQEKFKVEENSRIPAVLDRRFGSFGYVFSNEPNLHIQVYSSIISSKTQWVIQ